MIFERASRGKLIGQHVNCFSSHLDKLSYAANDAFLYNVTAASSAIDGGDINGTSLTRCHIEKGMITASRLVSTCVKNGRITHSMLDGCKVEGGIILTSVVENTTVRQGCVIENAIVNGLDMPELMRISGGTWSKLPRFHRIIRDGIDFGMTQADAEHAFIACTRKPMKRWIQGKKRFGKAIGWSDSILDEIEEVFTQWMRYADNI